MKATSTIPIVMRTAVDPVEAGFVASLARPGGNITGVTSITMKLIGKQLELLAEVVPGVKRIAVLSPNTDPARFMATDEYKEMEAAARVLGVKLQLLSARDPDTTDNAFVAMTKERAQALLVAPSPRYLEHGERILKHAAKNRLPAIYFQQHIRRERGTYVLRRKQCRRVPPCGSLCGQDSKGQRSRPTCLSSSRRSSSWSSI